MAFVPARGPDRRLAAVLDMLQEGVDNGGNRIGCNVRRFGRHQFVESAVCFGAVMAENDLLAVDVGAPDSPLFQYQGLGVRDMIWHPMLEQILDH